jgi:hypothetical protein
MTGTREITGDVERTCLACACAVRNPKSPQSFGDEVLTELVAGYLRDHRYQRGDGGSKVDRGDEFRAATLVHLVLGHSAEVERLRAVEVDERRHCDEQTQEIEALSRQVRDLALRAAPEATL